MNGDNDQQTDMGFGSEGTAWSRGDFNYDGIINGSDFALIDNTFNQITATGAVPLALLAPPAATSGSVPEPTTLGLVGLGVVGLLHRRRRMGA